MSGERNVIYRCSLSSLGRALPGRIIKMSSPIMDLSQLSLALGASLGVVSHLGYFIHGEHHRSSWRILQFFIAFPIVAVTALSFAFRLPVSDAASLVAIALLGYGTALTTSIFVYRGVFHRLRGYPGPALAKFSKFYESSCHFKAQSYKVLQKWHGEYGSYVRTGQNLR